MIQILLMALWRHVSALLRRLTTKSGRWLAVAGAALSALGCTPTATARLGLPELQTVPSVDLKRYTGTWYEIASFPQSFQKGCTATTAHYTARPDGDIDVVNRCRLHSPTGDEKVAHGRARVLSEDDSAKLEVSFFRPFWGDYWIIDLGRDYEYAVVGHPSRDYLWILAREPRLEPTVYSGIIDRLQANGYEVERLVKTVHAATAES